MKNLTKEQIELCDKIVTRAQGFGLYENNRATAFLDIYNAACHFDMRLEDWLYADKFSFMHDVVGISKAINRIANPVDFSNDPYFLPRFAKQEV